MFIRFIDISGDTPEEFHPKPARSVLPAWYRNLPQWSSDVEGVPKSKLKDFTTAKKCMPLLDVMTTGYIITTDGDLEIQKTSQGTMFSWADRQLVETHVVGQADGYPGHNNRNPFAKWLNNWGIQTQKGYSSLFVTPFHHETPLKILAGIVDTDRYCDAVHFPFLIDENFSGLIPAGTPVAQVIPFRREDFTHQIVEEDQLNPNVVARTQKNLRASFRRGYKDRFWQKKNYQ